MALLSVSARRKQRTFGRNSNDPVDHLFRSLAEIGRREADEINTRLPDVMRQVGGTTLIL